MPTTAPLIDLPLGGHRYIQTTAAPALRRRAQRGRQQVRTARGHWTLSRRPRRFHRLRRYRMVQPISH